LDQRGGEVLEGGRGDWPNVKETHASSISKKAILIRIWWWYGVSGGEGVPKREKWGLK